MRSASEERLRTIPWRALRGLASGLDAPLAEVLAGEPAERVVDRTLRRLGRPSPARPERSEAESRGALSADARAAVAEAIFGVAVWRRRLLFHLGFHDPAPRLLLAALLRDLGGLDDASDILDLPHDSLPPPRPPPDDPARRWSFPDALAAILAREVGSAELPDLLDALDRPGPVCLRPNLLTTTPDELAEALAAEGVTTQPGRLVPGALVVTSPRPNVYALSAHRTGRCEVQDEGSQLLGALVEARAGERVLDLCAGAGGKTLQLAASVGQRGEVVATDIDAERLGRLAERARRAGAAGIVRVHGERPAADLLADRVLVDAPCSELGALRRGPDRRFRLDPAALAGWPRLEAELLARGAAHVRPGGRLVYATCTLRREENEDVARAFEARHPGFTRVRPALATAPVDSEGFVHTLPHRHGCDGFFAALWERARPATRRAASFE
jgi:16S rRNA (cytosine967-C5)-methyltransferase